MFSRHIFLLPVLFFALPRLFAQASGLELPGQDVLQKIFNKPAIINTKVSQEKGSDNIRWIDTYTDIHFSTDISLDALRRTILDFDNYPRMFRRNQSISVIRKNGAVYHDMTMGAELMGISFLTKYRVLVTELVNTPEEFVIDYRFISGDGTIKEFYGRWYFEKIPQYGNGEYLCYVRCYTSSVVIRKYPLQRLIMSLFINSESRDLMSQFLKTAAEFPLTPAGSSSLQSPPF
ncbi:hypothetical protein AGMMS4952_01510 [Spirochaetia bacterium]|nr:hypothetical protein AGMMS4952_01510 [Spirochaetia bacterium]